MSDKPTLPTDPAEAIIAVGRLLYRKGLIAAADGNISVRDGKTILITPSGSHKGLITPGDIIRLDLTGRVVEGSGRPSTELPMHLAAYRMRPTAGAVVHAHPPTVVGLTVAGQPFDRPILPEVVMTSPPIPTVPLAPPGTDKAVAELERLLPDHPTVVLDRHGSLTVGRDLTEALSRLEQLEFLARAILTAQTMGRVRELTEEQVEELVGLGREKGYLEG